MITKRPSIPRDPVSVVDEITTFRTTDGKLHETMDTACDHQETIDFINWCHENLEGLSRGAWSIEDVATEILKTWKVGPK